MKSNLCLICGQVKNHADGVVSSQEFTEERASRAYEAWMALDTSAEKAREEFDAAERAYNTLSLELAELRRTIDRRTREIRGLQRLLTCG
jgi:hypothetical protein